MTGSTGTGSTGTGPTGTGPTVGHGIGQATGHGIGQATGSVRDPREVIRDEQLMRRPILRALGDGPLTVPQLAEAIGASQREVVFWVMGLRKYGWLTEIKGADDDGYFRYEIAPREGS